MLFCTTWLPLFYSLAEQIALQRSEEARDKRISRSYGHSLVGKRAEVKKFMQNWGPRITAIPLICTEGIIDTGIYEGNINGVTFHDFVTEKLCPNLLPFDGINPCLVVILGKL
ncbi:hypothetical protein OS493_009044 [Desmophyllum pertusum]|uniref:Uncharacterized protein n=1 Tax=Desmophyllum pertusum TaxID=174260 RepID=A0A9X0CYF4_9CNID|nr:hypothetical protein OS493_009044 [Desmophyllum pertusum]